VGNFKRQGQSHAHVVRRADQSDIEALLQTIRSMLSERYEIHHVTIQIEATPCDLAADVHRFGPEPGSAATAGHSGHAH
jgi:cobalt-zinc-cadmium efflux system protein